MTVYDKKAFMAVLSQTRLILLRINEIKYPLSAIGVLYDLRQKVDDAINYLESKTK